MPQTDERSASPKPHVRAWDLPTRLFKWSLVLLVGTAWVTQQFGDAGLPWHRMNGYAILILLVFRLLWGFAGSSTARFDAWVTWPWTALRYGLHLVAGRARPYLSHNPLGAWMIILLLVFVTAQGVTGLFMVDSNGVFGGPFAALDPLEDPTPLQRAMRRYHYQGYYVLLGLVIAHVTVNLYYQFVKKDPVVKAMITGEKPVEPFADQAEMRPAPASGFRAALCLLGATAIVLGGIKLFGGNLT